jgi:hypothetical protein
MSIKHFSIIFGVIVSAFISFASYAQTLPNYVPYCEDQLGIARGEIKGFDCNSGAEIPYDPTCEKHAFLTGDCNEGSRLGKLKFTNPDVSAVWICREGNFSINNPGFKDVAMIAHNKKSGKSCFFQARLAGFQPDGTYYTIPEQLPDPRSDGTQKTWLSPDNTAAQKCTDCHINDPYIVTNYLAAPFAKIGMMHHVNPKGLYTVVGSVFSAMNSAISRKEFSCAGSCHYEPSIVPTPFGLTMSEDAYQKGWMMPGLRSVYYKYERETDQPFAVFSTNNEAEYKNYSATAKAWITIDDNNLTNNNTLSIAAGTTKLYHSSGDGSTWRHSGKTACADTECYGWQKVGNATNNTVVRFYANDTHVAQQLFDGTLWRYAGNSVCTGNSCPGWTKIDTNVNYIVPENVSVAGGYVYQLNSWNTARGLARHNGSSSCSGSTCNGWQKLDNFDSMVSFSADGNNLYAVRSVKNASGVLRLGVWKFNGTVCNGNTCNGWQLLDNNQNVTKIVAGGNSLYQLRSDNTVWRYTGTACGATSCPGWERIDSDSGIYDLQASGSSQLYKKRSNSTIWRFKGTTCPSGTCSNWEQIDSSGAAVQIYTKKE